jgi:hypothetical protein
MSWPIESNPSRISPYDSLHGISTFTQSKELTKEQKKVVKDFFLEFNTKGQIDGFIKDLKGIVFIKHFPMVLLIGPNKTGLYCDTKELNSILCSLPSRLNNEAHVVLCRDPKKVDEELEIIKIKFSQI